MLLLLQEEVRLRSVIGVGSGTLNEQTLYCNIWQKVIATDPPSVLPTAIAPTSRFKGNNSLNINHLF